MELTIDFNPSTSDKDRNKIMRYRIYEYYSYKKKQAYIEHNITQYYAIPDFEYYWDTIVELYIHRSKDDDLWDEERLAKVKSDIDLIVNKDVTFSIRNKSES